MEAPLFCRHLGFLRGGSKLVCTYKCERIAFQIEILNLLNYKLHKHSKVITYPLRLLLQCFLADPCGLPRETTAQSQTLKAARVTHHNHRKLPRERAGADPVFLEGGAPLRNDVTGRWGKQILKANTKKAASHGEGAPPCTLPPDPPLTRPVFSVCLAWLSCRSWISQPSGDMSRDR